ncbi:MAG: amidophosphoribosyltransferase [Planctomycetaceae bacterium]|nr:amidophosphoribosyltransferase [Planctomycetaceae bacterium]
MSNVLQQPPSMSMHDECGVIAIYHLPGKESSPLCPAQGPEEISRLVPRMLLDLQNRGQLAAGFTTYSPTRNQLIDTYKEVGTVSEVFKLRNKEDHGALMRKYAGRAAIGHVRYASINQEDRRFAQPFERHHIKKHKWFSFAFNGQLANYTELRERLLADHNTYLALDTDTEIIMHTICATLSPQKEPDLMEVCKTMDSTFDGAYSIVFLNALGQMFVARDPRGMKPLCYAIEGPLFAAASESVALFNIGFAEESIKTVEPGQVIFISDQGIRFERFAESTKIAHCFFEWVYFANVASTIDGRSVYMARKNLGEELALQELEKNTVPIDSDTIVVPVPDTSKAAADAMAYKLGVPSLEGLIRNRYSGRTFIEGGEYRIRKAETKYTPLREVLQGKKVFLVEDSVVRSTTMRVLLKRLRELGQAREIHVRAACPPIIAPCFYGIDMPTYGELFAPKHLNNGPIYEWKMTPEIERRMAEDLGADSIRYLPIESVARAIRIDGAKLCQACLTAEYPTPWGEKMSLTAR